MSRWWRRSPLVGVVVPAYGVEGWIDECLASLVAQTHRRWEAVVVDDGSPDRSGEIAEQWARRDERIRVVHTENAGLGAARNTGVRHVGGDYLAFLDSDDALPPTAYADLVRSLERSGSDFATGSVARWVGGERTEPRWMRRLHRPPGSGMRIEDRPQLLGDVFAWNKLWRRTSWDGAGLSWPEGTRYEDQPTTTRSFLGGRFDVLDAIVYAWRVREGSITESRTSVEDLRDRLATKRASLASVREHASTAVEEVFLERVMPGDLWRYFLQVPGCTDEWWRLLQAGVQELWAQRSLVHSDLPPVHRLAGWLVEQDRRDDVVRLIDWHRSLGRERAPRVQDPATGAWRIAVPPEVLDEATVDPAALAVRPHEV